MPVTRSTGRGRSESATASATETSGSEATTATAETTDTSATGTTATGTTAATVPAAEKPQTEGATVSKQREDASKQEKQKISLPPPPGGAEEDERKQKRTPPVKRAESTHSKSKARKIAKAKQDLLRLQVELATARLAALETDEDSEDEGSVCTNIEAEARVDTWLNNQVPPPMLAIADHPHRPTTEESPPRLTIEERTEPEPQRRSQEQELAPAGGTARSDLTQLAEAITLAIKAGQRPKIIELPTFSGSHQDWLPFRAAYYETENMFSPVENMNRLRKNLKGRAREAVNSLLITTAHPSDIMKTLETRFGRPESIAMAEIETLRSLPRLNESPRDICIFSTRVTNAVSTLQALKCVYYMYNPEVTKTMVEKLTPTQRYRYFDFAAQQPKEEPDLQKMEKFLKREAELCGPYAQPEQVSPHTPNTANASYQRRPQRVHAATENRKTVSSKCPVCDNAGHTVTDCDQFKKADENGRWDLAKTRRLCFRCLHYRSKNHTCRPITCGINSCKYYHNKMLHYSKKTEDKEDSEEQQRTTETINSAWTAEKKQSFLKIMPVQVSGPAGTMNTFALLDDGSTVTLIDDGIANSIGAQGPIDPLHIEAINDMKTTESSSRKVTLKLKGPNRREELVQARTVKKLLVSPQRISRKQLQECEHLRDMSDILSYEDAKPGILIGQDNWHLLLATKTKKGNKSQPVASLTPLGWVLHGSYTRTLGRDIQHVNHVYENKTEDDLHEMIKQYFNMDALCLTPKRPRSDPEEQALRILEEKTVRKDGRYETALLWKREDVALPDNYDNSLRRLHNIEQKLDRNPQLKKKYTEQMEALVSKGYAERAPAQKTEDRTWYLPHFAVVNPMKPEKLRVVHDAAAKTRGVALNDLLLKGPDLLQSLPGVVMRFREHEIAITADITEMFMQVKLRSQDRDALRYLWRGERRDKQPPEQYRMTSLIFGASSSPSTAIYVKNINAKAHEVTHPEAAAAIVKKHYVDDYLDSFRTHEDAVRVVTGVRDIHQAAGFELKQWRSNSPALLEAIGETERIEETELYHTEEKAERVLGLVWKPRTDELTFNLNMVRIPEELVHGKTPTKREALRIVMSLFDPLGFASPVTIRAKQLLQEVWRRGTTWDTEIDSDLAHQWREWTNHLKSLREVTIPRRHLHYSDATSLQLHIFTDASESSYAAALYWRTVAPDGEVRVSLVLAKAKVTPLKLTSIPRLELQAAVMGTRLAEAVTEEHERKPESRIFWTDSRTTLTWIRTGSRSYRPYVAHRLAAIEETSSVKEWRWVPTKLNVADDATRDVPADFGRSHRWYRGPDFLYEEEAAWPTEQTATTSTEPTGEEKVNLVRVSTKQRLTEAIPEVARFSNWNRIRYATARVLLFIRLCRTIKHSVNYKKTKQNKKSDEDWRRANKPAPVKIKQSSQKPHEQKKYIPVPAELLKKAEELLMRASQEESFAQEIEDLQHKKQISKDSRLIQLSLEITDKTLRLRSRIDAAEDLEESVRRPMIVDGNHPTVKLWIQHVHRTMHHSGVEATVNECLQQYWVLRVRPVTKIIVKRCLRCRLKNQAPPHPRTGNLPSCRLAHHQRAFTYTGVDYFGPLTVTVGRTRQKRYVAIFTCLTVRAVHLEVAASLTTDSAIMALRRMVARRGCPTEIWSDNGTNLRGADKELRQAIDEATAAEAAKRTIAWRFIPPGAPFMGGAWERMVRSVKIALDTTLHEKHPTEEVLTTLLAEAEYTVNSRPLTHVSVSAEDPEALTPNHFLLGGPGRVPRPGTFEERDLIHKTSWRAAQRLADVFWTRWLREYLPGLQNRREPNGTGAEVKVGDLIQLTDPNLPRNVWIRGRVINTYPGPDGVVRTVDVKTKGGVLRRPVRKMVVLPIEDVAPVPGPATMTSYGGRNVQDDATQPHNK